MQAEADESEKLLYQLHSHDILPALGTEQIIRASTCCPDIAFLQSHLQNGTTPSNWEHFKPYRRIFQELTLSFQGNVLRGEQLVVPSPIRAKVLELAHGAAHLGIVSLKRRLRAGFWYPGMDQDAEEFVKACEKCQLYVPEEAKPRPRPQGIPPYPWHTISVDLFGPTLGDRHVVVAQCNSSRYPAAVFIRKPSTGLTVGALRAIFEELGYPRSIRTDNAALFHSSEFAHFLESAEIQHTFSPPYHPQFNPAECTMKLIGKAIKMSKQTPRDMERAVAEAQEDYRRTPHPATGVSPRTLMARAKDAELISKVAARDREIKRRRRSKYNQPSKELSLTPGQQVRHKVMNKKSKFHPLFSEQTVTVQARLHGDTYLLRHPTTDSTMVRHRDHIKPVASTLHNPDHSNPHWEERAMLILQPSPGPGKDSSPDHLDSTFGSAAELGEEGAPPPGSSQRKTTTYNSTPHGRPDGHPGRGTKKYQALDGWNGRLITPPCLPTSQTAYQITRTSEFPPPNPSDTSRVWES